MKQLLTFSLLLFMAGILMPGCKKNNGPENPSGEKYTLGLAAHVGFDNDEVVIYVDGDDVFNKTITTNPSLGLAGSASLTANAGQHSIKLVVNGRVTKTQTVTLSANLYVGIDYEAHGPQATFVLRDQPFVYD